MKGGFIIKIIPINSSNTAVTYLKPTYSPIQPPMMTTSIGATNIMETASPNGKYLSPSMYVIIDNNAKINLP